MIKKDIEKYFDLISDKNKTVFMYKNEKYGNSAFESLEEFGDIYLAIRLKEKTDRLKSVVKGVKDDETLIDLYTDIAVYCIIGLMYIEMNKEI